MKSWLRQHRAALAQALRKLRRSPLNVLLSLLVIGIAMTLPTAGHLLLENAQRLAGNLSGVQEISLFIQNDAPPKTLQAVEAHLLEHLPGQWRFVSRDAALDQLKAREEMKGILEGLPRNPLPDAFVLTPKETGAAALESLRDRLAALPGVAHVQLDSAWVRRFEAFLRLGRLAVGLISVIFAVGLVAVTFNTIRLQVLAQAVEIEVARLVGATDAFIRRPFYYFGMLQGALGGLAADFLITLGFCALREPVARLAELYDSPFQLFGLTPQQFLTLPLVGALLGWFGARLSVSLALRQIEKE